MELIPILSMIILVATISTFILAIGSYILYKVRERKAQAASVQRPAVYQAEVISPISIPAEAQGTQFQPYSEVRPVYSQESYIPSDELHYGQEPAPAAYNPQPRPFTGTGGQTQRAKTTDENKYMKYTSEGYIPPSADKKSGTAKWK
ncbi:MAG: hypothetical protein NZM09_04420 [Ignavibacterium sp.]|nr:hypothetical protein [Ignavibacterium sp.]MCX7612520.1 hypothetical protein [Ignavibacterium sp.]MDW8374922.1 hypothetical protein [Ignavibacteriales bacterium]